jgi:CHAT domain-containing protein/Tfp pilus assembly protein PilF
VSGWRLAIALALSLALGSAILPAGHAAESPPGPLARAAALTAEVLEHLRQGQYRAAVPKAREALSLRQQALGPRHPDVADSLNNLGVVLQHSGDHRAARPLLEQALAIWEGSLGADHPSVATALTNLAEVRWRDGDLAAARPLYERALAIRERALGPDHPEVAQSLNNLAVVVETTGDYRAARTLYERALGAWERALGPDHPDVATGLNNLGLLLQTTGDFSAARPLLERALRIREQVLGPIHPDVAGSLNNLGLLLWVTGDYAGARPVLEEALVMAEQVHGPQHPAVASASAVLAQFLHASGDLAAARTLHERALQVREQALGPSHPDVATSLYAFGQLLRDSGDSAAARPLLERAVAVREVSFGPGHPDVAAVLNALAYLRHLENDQAGARPLAERGLRIREQAFGARHPAVAASAVTLAEILRASGDRTGARPLYERSLAILRAIPMPEWRRRAALGLGRIAEDDGRLADALALYEEAVATVDALASHFPEELRRRQYLGGDRRFAPYDALAALLLKLHLQDPARGYDRQASAVLEAKKGRIVAEALAHVRPGVQDPRARAEADEVRLKQDQVVALERALVEELTRPPTEQRPERVQTLTTVLAKTKTEYLAQVGALLARYPQYRRQFVDQHAVDPRALAKFARRLPPGTLAVQYFAAPDALYLLLVAPGDVFQVKRRAVAQADLSSLIMRYREHVEQAAVTDLAWEDDGTEAYRRAVAPLKAITRTLSEHLLGPIEAELAAHRGLILVPSDLLLLLPIHALTRPGPDGAPRFLVETHAVSYMTQLELADVLAPPARRPDVPLLALGNPDGSLPSASQEIRQVRATRAAVTTLEGNEATKVRFLGLVPRFPDLHLATHGVLDPDWPERSYLLMAGADEGEKRLGIDQIAGLSLRDGLAVLSACETAVNERLPGAALVTLAAAFSQAGSRSIVASLWRVDDAATAELMVSFHRTLRRASRVVALQQAQIAMIRNPRARHPYYWAPFVLIGGR